MGINFYWSSANNKNGGKHTTEFLEDIGKFCCYCLIAVFCSRWCVIINSYERRKGQLKAESEAHNSTTQWLKNQSQFWEFSVILLWREMPHNAMFRFQFSWSNFCWPTMRMLKSAHFDHQFWKMPGGGDQWMDDPVVTNVIKTLKIDLFGWKLTCNWEPLFHQRMGEIWK